MLCVSVRAYSLFFVILTTSRLRIQACHFWRGPDVCFSLLCSLQASFSPDIICIQDTGDHDEMMETLGKIPKVAAFLESLVMLRWLLLKQRVLLLKAICACMTEFCPGPIKRTLCRLAHAYIRAHICLLVYAIVTLFSPSPLCSNSSPRRASWRSQKSSLLPSMRSRFTE
jgi:hypothetical protein